MPCTLKARRSSKHLWFSDSPIGSTDPLLSAVLLTEKEPLKASKLLGSNASISMQQQTIPMLSNCKCSHEDPLVPIKEVQGQLHCQSFTAAPTLVSRTSTFSFRRYPVLGVPYLSHTLLSHDVASFFVAPLLRAS